MNETCSARPVGGFSVGPREEYRPGPEPFRRDAGRVTATVSTHKKDETTGVVVLNQTKTQAEIILDAVKTGHQSLNAIQRCTGFDRKKIRDIANKQVKAGKLLVQQQSITDEKIFALPDQKEEDVPELGSQVSADVHAETEIDDDAELPKDAAALMFSENNDVGSTGTEKGFEMEKSETDLGYMHARLEHLYRTAQSSLGAFWESVVELRTMADDALQAKEKLLKVYEALGQVPVHIDGNGHGKGSRSDVQP